VAEIDKILAVPGVEAIRWTQFTPYFNDGDECSFGVHEIRIKIEGAELEDYDYERDDGFASAYSLFEYNGTYEHPGEYPPYVAKGRPGHEEYEAAVKDVQAKGRLYYSPENKTFVVNGFDTTPIRDAVKAFNTYEFEHVLETNFGDHAEVTATKDGFSIEFFDHE
jgi:hypothetical protein